ncbi:hypothetical protein [Prochlorococcus sp. MIT 1223]|uniref:hypothetical protein n=1 Tax=Prochlorococcus sp. MIT 1223 TaxID=3096217 RepID=UPI002A7507AB|nr:hypothetical protein [Prochlorococcus sp. MIT 1223]
MKINYTKVIIKKQKSNLFSEIDSKMLIGWECNKAGSKQKKYLDQIKRQTAAAMQNKKYYLD